MEFDLRRYVRIVTNWWWLLVIGAVIPTLVSYHFVSQQPDIYQARVILRVGTALQSANPDTGAMGVSQVLARAYAEMLRYRPVADEVIEKLGLQRTPEQLSRQISTSIRPEANLLEIYVADTDPEVAALIANALAQALISQSPASQTQGEQQRFVERQLSDLKAKIEKIEDEIEQQTAALADLTSAADIKAAQENVAGLETVVSRYRSEYALYLQAYAGDSVNQLTILEPATPPLLPMGRKKLLILGIAGAAGLGLALAGVFLIEYSDDTLRWDEVRHETLHDWPVLGGISRMAVSKELLLQLPNDRSMEAESLRAVRANLLLTRLRHSYQTVLVSSAASQEGKSWTTSSLGVSLAAAGLRVIIVDGDMRKPSLHRVFDLANVYGLTDLLDASTTVAEIESLRGLQETGANNLWVLPAGKIPLDPLMLLMSERLSVLVGALRGWADIVIFDAAPMMLFPDASVLAAHCDVVLLVVAHEVTTYRQVQQMRGYLDEHKEFNLLGVIYNQVRLGERSAYYYYQGRKPVSLRAKELWGVVKRLRGSSDLPQDDPERLVPLSEAAGALGITSAMARRWARTGRLPATRERLRYGVRQRDLKALIEMETGESAEQILFTAENGQDATPTLTTVIQPEEITTIHRVAQE